MTATLARSTFQLGRINGLARQRDTVSDKLATLRRDIHKLELRESLCSLDHDDTDAKLDRMRDLARRWANDIDRLDRKISKL